MGRDNSLLGKGAERDKEWSEMFPNIAGYNKVREEASQIIDIIQRKEEYLKIGAHCPRGWFFYGDPGMGKTQIVKDIASYVDYPIIEISSSDAIKRKISIDEDIVNGFIEAKKLHNCIVFIDEMDKFAGYKKYAYELPDNLKTQKILLHELDEIKNYNDIVVIATGNKKDYLDEAILRSGRFDRQVLFSRPNEEDRESIIKHFLKNIALDENVFLDDLVKMTAGRSCAEIECMVNEAKISLVRNHQNKLQLGDFTAALNRIIFSDIPKDSATSNEQLKLVAYHEIGHALIGYVLQPENVHYVSIIPQGNAAGKTKMNADDDIVKKKEYSEHLLRITLGGMVAVRVMAGTMTGGNKSDIEKAISIVTNMLDEGFYGMEYLSFAVNKDTYGESRFSSELSTKRGAKIVELMNKAIDDVEKILTENKDVLAKMAEKLIEKRELSNKELVEIIEKICNKSKFMIK